MGYQGDPAQGEGCEGQSDNWQSHFLVTVTTSYIEVRRQAGNSPADRQPRVAEDNEPLRQARGRDQPR